MQQHSWGWAHRIGALQMALPTKRYTENNCTTLVDREPGSGASLCSKQMTSALGT